MHESSLIPDLLRTVEQVPRAADARKVVRVALTVGAFAALSPDHLRDHFRAAAAGTIADGAELEIVMLSDPGDPFAYGVRVQNLDVSEEVS